MPHNDTRNLCHLAMFIPKTVPPSACLSFGLFVQVCSSYIYIFFSNHEFFILAPLTNATLALSTLLLNVGIWPQIDRKYQGEKEGCSYIMFLRNLFFVNMRLVGEELTLYEMTNFWTG